MMIPQTWSIRSQLAALIAAVMVPLVAAIAILAYNDYTTDTERAVTSARGLADTTATEVLAMIRDAQQSMEILAQRPLVQAVDAANCDSLLSGLHQVSPRFADIGVVNLAGQVVCSSRPQRGPGLTSVARLEWFQRVLREKRFVISKPFVGPITGRMVSVLALPVVKGGVIKGVIALPVDLLAYRPAALSGSLPQGTVLGILDGDGTLMWRSADPEKWIGKNMREREWVRRLLASQGGVADAVELDGTAHVHGVSPVRGYDWYAYASIPSDEIYGHVYRNAMWSSLVGIAGLGLALGLAWVLARRLAQPVRALGEAVRAVRSGALDTRVAEAGPGEFADLTKHFNAMLDARQRQEQLLSEKTALLTATLENIAQGISVFDSELRLIGFNQRYLELLDFPATLGRVGVAFEDFIRFNALRGDYGPGDVDEQVQTRVDFARKFEPHRVRRVRSDGGVLEIVGKPLPGGGIVTTYTDITEQDRAQAAMRLSEQRYRLLVELSPDAVYVIRKGIILFANEAALKLWGVASIEEAVGKDLLTFIHPGSRAVVMQRIGVLESSGETGFRVPWIEEQYSREDGTVVAVEASATRIALEDGLAVLSVARDITERKRAEEERLSLEAQLRQSQRMEAIGTLAGGIAHDFNNILSAILGNVDLAREDTDTGHPAVESLDEIRKAAMRARDLVQQILAFSRSQEPQRSVMSLRPVVDEVSQLLRKTLPAGIEITTVLQSEAPLVLADSGQIHQVLMNLCTNAWHSLDNDTGRIEIRLDRLQVSGSGAQAGLAPGVYARLAVADSGHGMDAATAERIFEPFFTTKEQGKGTGLGLSVVHGIVKNHDGIISVESHPGLGTTFTLFFPQANIQVETGAAEGEAAGTQRGAGQHILFLDDDEALVQLAVRTLQRLGYRVSGFTDAPAALAAFRADPGAFDLVITDYSMPGMSGLDVAHGILKLKPELPVVLASGSISEELMTHARTAGVAHVVYKPNTVEEFADVIHRLAPAPNPRKSPE